MYTTSTTIKGESRGDPEAIYQWAAKKGANRLPDLKLYLETVYKLCRSFGLRAEVLVAQSAHETSDPDTGAPWASYWWRQRLNPAGIGITGDDAQNNASRTFADGAAAARAHCLHMWVYTSGASIPTGLSKSDDPRWQAAVDAGYAGIAKTIADLTNRWGMDNQYAQGVAKWLNVLDGAGLLTAPAIPSTTTTPAPVVMGGQEGSATVATEFTKYTFPGLPNPVYLPSWIQVDIMIIPSSTPGWTSGQKIPASNFTTTTYHDTGNPSSSALSEYTWARNGGRAEINSAGSYNGIFDKSRIIITQRFDELVGQAANPTGNVTSYAFEEAYGAGGHAGALIVGQWLHAGVLQAMGKSGGTEAMVQHNYWSGKDCPSQIRANGEWSKVEKAVDANVAAINAWLKAGGAGAGTTTPKPVMLKQGDTVAASEALNLRQAAGTSAPVVAILAAGDTGTITGEPVVKDGYTWRPLTMASGQSGYAAQDWLTKTNAPTTTPKPTTPTYATPMPIPALVAVDTTKPDTAPGAVVDGGTDFVFVGDLVEVTKGPLKRLQRTGDPSTTVGPDLKVGDRFIASWLYRVTEGALKGALVYVTPTWERVVYKDADGTEYTKRIADVPELTAGAK